jgi:hypothetical protein
MTARTSPKGIGLAQPSPLLLVLIVITFASATFAQNLSLSKHQNSAVFSPGNLVISRSLYDNNPGTVQVGEPLPPGCTGTQAGCNGNATYDGTYPTVWNNNLVDGSFGITSKIYLDQYTPNAVFVNSLEVPNSLDFDPGPTPLKKDQLVTSFSSKSELALNLSTDGSKLTFMGYFAPIDSVDLSNSSTPGVGDPTNPVTGLAYRAVADVMSTAHSISR